jgi:hypothetical protein
LTADATLVFTAPIETGSPCLLRIKQDGTGGRKIIWPGTVVWLDGSVPQPRPGVNAITLFEFFYESGPVYYGRSSTPRVLFADGVVSTTSTSEVSITSVPILGGTLFVTSGQVLRISAVVIPTTQAGTFILKYGTTNLLSTAIAVNNVGNIDVRFWRFGSNVQARAECLKTEGSGGTATVTESNTGTVADNTDNTQTLDFRGLVTSGGTLTIRQLTVEYLAR